MSAAERPQDVSLTFVGNATVLLRLGPFTLLTDPNFLHAGQRAYLGYGLWSKRLRDPAMALGELPPLDAVVLSHLHGDHWDRVAERGLREEMRRETPVLSTHAAARRLDKRGFETQGLRTWQTTELVEPPHRLTITAMPGRHGPGVIDRLLPDVMGSLIDLEREGRRQLRLYISGDTLCVPQLSEISDRYPDIDIALVHLGGTKLLNLVTVTMDGRQGARLMAMLRPGIALPIHHDDYTVFKSPVSDFFTALAAGDSEVPAQSIGRGSRLDLHQHTTT